MRARDSQGLQAAGGGRLPDRGSAREIEDVLRRHPKVRDVAVVGAPDRIWGQKIVAAVVLHPAPGPSPTASALLEELSSFCAKSLADYKRPREVQVVEALPRNALGKVQKHLILGILREAGR